MTRNANTNDSNEQCTWRAGRCSNTATHRVLIPIIDRDAYREALMCRDCLTMHHIDYPARNVFAEPLTQGDGTGHENGDINSNDTIKNGQVINVLEHDRGFAFISTPDTDGFEPL